VGYSLRSILALLGLSLAATFSHGADVRISGNNSLTDYSRISVGRITRDALTAEERNSAQPAHFVLKLRNLAELQKRIDRGEVLSVDEMVARYFPTKNSWSKVAAWAKSKGLQVDDEDVTHLTVFSHGTVSSIGQALHIRFARVIGIDGREYTSAIDDPVVDFSVASELVGVMALQPHLRPKSASITPIGITVGSDGGLALSPITVAQWYHVHDLGYSGAGQTIVIVGISPVATSDLTAFWTKVGLPVTLAQYLEIDPAGPLTDAGTLTNSLSGSEPTLDLEWASSMAPGAKLIYLTSISTPIFTTWIVNNLKTYPSIHQLSISYIWGEDILANKYLQADSQYFAALAALGVTTCVSSGDNGSNYDDDITGERFPYTLAYDPLGPTAPNYPASDPNVLSVGGTTLTCSNGQVDGAQVLNGPITEGAWCLYNSFSVSGFPNAPPYYGFNASSGGVSAVFDRPSWQMGAGVPTSINARCVPDVAAMAGGTYGYAYFAAAGGDIAFAGTSQSAPIWAGIAAVLNEALVQAGRQPLGNPGAKFYPLLDTAAFNAMGTGSYNGEDGFLSTATNGAYKVGPNYTMITGLGSPNVTAIIGAITASTIYTTPAITTQPVDVMIHPGQDTAFAVTAAANPAPTFQWQKNGADISGAGSSALINGSYTSTFTVFGAQPADAASYDVVVSNLAGSVTSSTVTLTLNAVPSFPAQPQSQSAAPGSSVTFSAIANGMPTPTYQWYFNDQAIAGATSASYAIASVQASNAGSYVAVAANAVGSTSSLPAMLTVNAPSGGPAIVSQPGSQTVAIGSTVVFSVTSSVTGKVSSASAATGDGDGAAGGTNVSYQWYLNGNVIAGTNRSTLLVHATAAAAGAYTCLVSSASGAVLSNAGVLTVSSISNPGRLINLSVYTLDGPGDQLLTMGFVIGGSGTSGAQTLLIRASGPALLGYGVPNVLADPSLAVLSGATTVASNDNWGTPSSNQAAVTTADAATGAFLWYDPTSLDAALVATLAPNPGYTVQVSGNGSGMGNTLAEVYDDTAPGTYSVTTPRLINMSCRQEVMADGVLEAGFTIGGSTAKTVLIRASGPALGAYGVTGVMPDPTLTVYRGSTSIASNTGWGGDPNITTAGNSVGAFGLTNPASADSALLVTLPPGSYTAVASSVSGTAGIALVEVYDVP